MGGRGTDSGFVKKSIIKMTPEEREIANRLTAEELKIAKELESVLEKEYNTCKGNIKPEYTRTVRAYTGKDHLLINNALSALDKGTLRSGALDKPLDKGKSERFDDLTVRQAIKNLDSAIKDSGYKLDRDITFVRYTDGTMLGLGENPELVDVQNWFARNRSFTNPRYMSTSTRPNKQFGRIRYEITLPKGKNAGLYIDSVSQYSDQHEFLFSRDSLYVAKSVEYINGEIVVKAKWAGATPKKLPPK